MSRHVSELETLIATQTNSAHVPLASSIQENIPVYDCARLASHLDGELRQNLMKELAQVLLTGAGVFVLKSGYQDTSIIDEATDAFNQIIAREKQGSGGGGDHFAKAGSNDRIWNSLEKLCREAPELYVRYHANRWLELAAESWLGPAFQMTAQVNLVHPGGAAQEGHCDYHLGFMTAEQVASYPAHIHATSAQLTLQGAIAHGQVPIESGPTKLLPHSQKWPHNYALFRENEVRALFEANFVQLPLDKGDLVFFSPGLLHGAGDNRTQDIHRLVNLVQISSAFGRAMETIDRTAMCKTVFPFLKSGTLSAGEIHAVIASTAEGYSFPTNLDNDPPIGGLAPQSQQALMHQALREDWDQAALEKALDERDAKRRA
ncbi:phytanoyl-CoA dioxygenase family protein [Pseudahrensia aquimaris]|uniref:Phytanoyl-CoA dioxygenase family protein n=1 Tax=Pseudahrensia aquimaris TaxID=744461 RepID=A0ABW3FD71_9HYPH